MSYHLSFKRSSEGRNNKGGAQFQENVVNIFLFHIIPEKMLVLRKDLSGMVGAVGVKIIT